MRRLVLPLCAGAAAAFAPAAAAHAVLLRTAPADGAVLGRSPSAVRLVFAGGFRAASGNRAIRNGGGSVLAGPPRVEGRGRVLVLPLAPGLPAGDYSVRWSIVSDDGHHESGVLAFAVGAGRAPPTAELEAGGGLDASTVAARAVFFAGLLLAVGSAVFRLAVGRAGRTPLVLLVGLVLVAPGAAWLAHGAPASTRFALAYWAAAAIAAVGAMLAGAGLSDPWFLRGAEVTALLLVPIPSVAGHALDPGQPRLLELAADLVHVTAASVWVGGLVALILVPAAERGEYGRRFGRIALVSVAALVASGIVRALDELSSPGQLVHTGYGRALLVKSALLALAVGLAWLNRERLATLGLRGEAVVLAGVVVAVAFLTALPPGKDLVPAVAAAAPAAPKPPPPPPRGAVVLAREDGPLAVALAARGPQLTATVIGQDGGGSRGLDVTFRSGGRSARARLCGPGCYRATLAHGRRVTVAFPGSSVPFRLPAGPTPPAGAIVRRAARVFRGLSSVTFDERLSSGPRHVVRTRFVMAAPNLLTYRSNEGSSAVVIGGRRWDRQGTGPWVESQTTPLQLPAPFWTRAVRNARLLSRSGGDDVVSFYDAQLHAWFEAVVERRTGRTRALTMTAGAHFMHHSYRGFDAPVRIRPPR